jgi:uroporphyrinogen decarboxylase
MGDEEGLMAFHTMPDLVHDIMDHLTTIHCTVFEKAAREFPVDVIHLWEDICFKNGPFISPDHWKEFIAPCYRRIKALADRFSIPVISVDTDGNAEKLLPLMMECGVNLIYPLEVTAGMDVNRLKEKFPGLAMMGGIDKRALATGREAIDRELERVRPAVRKGRYIPDLDHLVPDNVSWENYSYYALRLKELIGKAD